MKCSNLSPDPSSGGERDRQAHRSDNFARALVATMFALAGARSPQMHVTRTLPTSPLPQMHLTRTLPRRSAVHRCHQPAMSARAPGEDDEDGEDISEGWRPEVELARLRLESVLSESEDLSDPDTWAAQTDLLKQRAKRNRRKEVVDAVGGLAFGAAW